jgi:hypothetical protein
MEKIYDLESQSMLAIIIRNEDLTLSNNIVFFTSKDEEFQFGAMHRNEGYKIDRHLHPRQQRIINRTSELLLVRGGSVRVDFYNNDRKWIASEIVKDGEFLLSFDGGHSFEFIESSMIIELKQGPYDLLTDKIRF